MNLKNKKSIEKNQKGVTMIALIITIIVLLIIASISIGSALNSHETAAKNKILTEVGMVQHAALERYTKQVTIGNENFPGEEYTSKAEIEADIDKIKDDSKLSEILNNTTPEDYYFLDKNALKNLGVTDTEDSYIINYKLGIAINATVQVTEDGKPLYVYSKDSDD